MISETLRLSLVRTLENAGCTECYLFGSHATGNATDNSDIDIGVKGLEAEKFFTVHSKLEEIAGTQVDLVDFDEQPRFFQLLQDLGELKKIG